MEKEKKINQNQPSLKKSVDTIFKFNQRTLTQQLYIYIYINIVSVQEEYIYIFETFFFFLSKFILPNKIIILNKKLPFLFQIINFTLFF